MADGLLYTPGAGATVATDDAGGSGHVQIVKLALSADASATPITADATGFQVANAFRVVRISQTPTVATSGYAANDFVGTKMTFAGAARASGGSGRLVGATLTSRAVVANAYELWLFEANPTIASADNATWDLTDANLEAGRPFAVVNFIVANNTTTASGQFTPGTIAAAPQLRVPYVTSGGTSIYGALVVRTAAGQPGSTADLVVNIYVELD